MMPRTQPPAATTILIMPLLLALALAMAPVAAGWPYTPGTLAVHALVHRAELNVTHNDGRTAPTRVRAR